MITYVDVHGSHDCFMILCISCCFGHDLHDCLPVCSERAARRGPFIVTRTSYVWKVDHEVHVFFMIFMIVV